MANEVKPPEGPGEKDPKEETHGPESGGNVAQPTDKHEAKAAANASSTTELDQSELKTSSLEPTSVPLVREQRPTDDEVEREMRRRARRSFLVGGAVALAGLGLGEWLITRREEDGIIWPLRRVLEVNQEFASDYFSNQHLAKTFPASEAVELRQNGDEGLDDDFDPEGWRLEIAGLADPSPFQKSDSTDSTTGSSDSSGAAEGSSDQTTDSGGDDDDDDNNAGDDDDSGSDDSDSVYLNLDDLKSLPRVELVAEFKCIEGWSQVVQWAGARFADFAAKYGPATRDGSAPDVRKNPQALVRYVSMETPDAGYYVGLDMQSALHPQTLLCYEMNGKPLTLEHGAPLRLVTPVKYGIKCIKRIGKITFTDTLPADYWAERGYDWYAGL
ncbi:MAG: molybdopterin-dependent oxidoreductase [Blastocatellia bacterium]